MSTNPEKRKEALAFLQSQDLGVLATATTEDGPSARALYYAADDDFNIFFITLKNTRKVGDLLKTGKAAFVISDAHKPATIQIQGIISDHTDGTTIEPSVIDLAKTMASKGDHFAPLTHLDPSTVKFFKLTPTWIRYGDFSAGDGNKEVYTEILPASEK